MSNPTLIGPPEIYIAGPTATLAQTAPAPASDPAPIPTVTGTTPSDPFMDLMVSPNMTLTENSSPTFLTTGNPCLDFFFHVVPDTPPATLLQRLQLAWAHNSLTALKLVCNLRGIRGTGKSDRRNFYGAAIWLHRHHPKTLAANIPSLADFGYFKDLPEILYLLVEGSDAREIQKREWCKEKLKSGKSTIAAGALLPHQIIRSLDNGDCGDVADLQWKRVVDDLKKKGTMKSCLAVCDVSGSMDGLPLEVCVALGLLVSELCEEPWKGKVVTFSADPQLHLIKGDDLKSKKEFVMNMDAGWNTDFQKVFDLILEVAVSGNLKADQMIKKLFVFSDMEFDQASTNPWETDYQAITRKFGEKGFGDVVPQMIFWNLRDSKATPVPANQKGVALLSGFSKNLLTLFLDKEGELNSVETMEAAISGSEYQKLVVLD
ncbi:hypothetical protein V8G54_014086 [Vigna mungo]|uniref:von Willebrand factor, type A n=1 Tax=Vigna mungo TaxID=3915 RepID=A0AAQ3RYY4_VIGMU